MKMKKIIYFIAAVILAGWGCNLNRRPAEPEPKQMFIAYNAYLPDSVYDDNWDIFIMNMDGTGTKNITNHPDVAWTYYTFRDRLFFISDRDTCHRCYFLYESDPDGNNIRKVSDLQLEDSWMSSRNDGGEMIVTGRIGSDLRRQLFIINTNNGEYTQITSDTSAWYGDPCFSPDGKKIVFSYKKNKRDRSAHEELCIMKEDGSGMKQITHYPEDNPSAKEYGYRAGAARWHPSGKFISYVSKQDGKHSLFAVTPDGKKQWKLTENEFVEFWHDWSSDGKWLVISSSDKGEQLFDIALMNWETRELQRFSDSVHRIQQAPVFVEKF